MADGVRAANAAIRGEDYRLRRDLVSARPSIVFIELTRNCNLACTMCRPKTAYDRMLDMPLELFARIVNQCGQQAELIDLNGWGESTLHPQIGSCIRLVVGTGARVRLVTNGQCMRDELWEVLLNADGIVVVSVDTLRPEMSRFLGRGDVSRLKRALEFGAAIRHRMGKGQICINMAVNNYTTEDIPHVVKLARNLGVDRVLLNPVRCGSTSPLALRQTDSRLAGLLDEASAIVSGTRTAVRVGAALSPGLVVGSALPEVCSNPWTNAVFSCTGQVSFCHHGIGWTQESVSTQSIESLWNGRPARALRRAHANAQVKREALKCYEKCNWCYSNRYGDPDFPCANMRSREVSTKTMSRLHPLGGAPSTRSNAVVTELVHE